MLAIKSITKRYGGVKALDKCSFKVEQGQIVGLVGPNGAGKTTLFDVISGLVSADNGSVLLDGKNLLGVRSDEIAQLGLARTWQQVRLFDNLLVYHHLVMAENDEDVGLMRNLFANKKHFNWDRHKEHLLDFGLDKKVKQPVSSLSYGQRKLLQLAMATLKPHKLLLLDEPVAGVNQVVQEKIEQLLLGLKERGETVVIIEHDMEFVKKLADKLVVLDQGKVLTEGGPGIVLRDQRVIDSYLGL